MLQELRTRFQPRVIVAAIAALLLALTGVGFGQTSPATAATAPATATTANFVATGHDVDFHCYYGQTPSCDYLKVIMEKVRNGSSLPVLAIDSGAVLNGALQKAGVSPVEVANPDSPVDFNNVAFVDDNGAPLYSAIVVASSIYIVSITPAQSATINARADDFKEFFNAGGGIFAMSSGGMPGYYDFVPIPVTGTSVMSPFTVTEEGAAIGITVEMANCCATHNSFAVPDAPLVALELDAAAAAETIAAFGVTIGDGGFTTAPVVAIDGGEAKVVTTRTPTITGTTDAADGSTVTVTIADQSLTTTAEGGAWSVVPAPLADGSHTVTASVTDAGGNAGTATQALTVDTVAPELAIGGGSARSVATPAVTVSGTTDAADGSTITVTLGDQTLTGTASSGTWTVTPAPLSDGSYTVTATVADAAGNTATATQALSVDTVAPELAITGGSDRSVTTATPTITGTTDAADGSTVTVTVDAQTLTGTAHSGTWAVTPASLSDGDYTVTATVADAAGNTATATQALTVDTVPPALALALDFRAGSRLSDASTTISAQGLKVGSTYTLVMHSTPVTLYTGTIDASGAFTRDVALPENAPAGKHRLILTGVAPDGSTMTSEAGFTLLANGVISATSSTGTGSLPESDIVSVDNTIGETVDVDVLGSGNVDAGSLRILDGTTPVTSLVVDGEGTWSVVNGMIRFTPEAGFRGNPAPVAYQVTDADGAVVSGMVTVGYAEAASSPAGLASTGLNLAAPITAGLLVLLLGGAMLVLARRRIARL